MRLELHNHYPAPVSFEHQAFEVRLLKVYRYLLSERLIIEHAPLEELEQVEFNLVNTETITELHEEYLNDPTTTDVITFQHGEVFVCYDTAVKECEAREITQEEELFRYHVHGLLHLAGYEDKTCSDFKRMTQLQEKLVAQF